jgi:hypothetical protein
MAWRTNFFKGREPQYESCDEIVIQSSLEQKTGSRE